MYQDSVVTGSSPAQDLAGYPLYDPRFEHDACGTGCIVHVSGQREHRILAYALEALERLAHRGAMDASAEVSDGVGVLTQLPVPLFNRWVAERGHAPLAAGELAAGMLFLPTNGALAQQARALLAETLARRGIPVLGWREVPTDPDALADAARASCPRIEQVLVRRPAGLHTATFERLLYLARKETERRLTDAGLAGVYIASLSARTIVYKGLLTAATLPRFYHDLRDPDFTTALALFHQRYSTNTFPSWRLAQPMRLLAHNGEINTVQGNRNWMAAREARFSASAWGEEAAWLSPVIEPEGSDSASLDNALELLTRSGRSLPHALTMLTPAAWQCRDDLSPPERALFEAHAPLVEPWDGPAALVFSDGHYAGAALDRNGLRPLRYTLTEDGLLVVASETGVVELEEERIRTKGRLGPGEMLVVDVERGELLADRDLKRRLAEEAPYAAWVARHIVPVTPSGCGADGSDGAESTAFTAEALLSWQARFGYSHEDVELVLRPMVAEGTEAVWSMGDDTPLAVFSRQPRPLASYFRQRFAQVTNPPIDSLREQLVMSLTSYLGARPPLLDAHEPAERLLRLATPVLDERALHETLAAAMAQGLPVVQLRTGYVPGSETDAADAPGHADGDTDGDTDGGALASALDALERAAVAAVRGGARVVVLSDRELVAGEAPLPVPLGLAAAHHALLHAGLRTEVGLVVETGGVWDVHGLALLIGYGANAVCPYLALATARALAGTRGLESLTPGQAARHLTHALEKGLLKVLARMGLSTVESYLGAQLFECLGLAPELTARYFPGTPSALGGLTLGELDRRARLALTEASRLSGAAGAAAGSDGAEGQAEGTGIVALRGRLADRGYVRYRRTAEYHAANPIVVKALQRAVRSGNPEDYQRYTELVYSRPPTAIRDLLALPVCEPVPLDEVEPVERIVRRFVTTAMSLGSLSPEAHLTLTLGANLAGARSNTGEGGEDPGWLTGRIDGISTNSRIKQVASARFGVTTSYLAHAEELEIKMAQGSKPGEGGQLPARKVSPLIARLRHTTQGIALISPPPHHDIYSIEDLAQLIFDLKRVNPHAAVGVKLVAGRGVGTIAAGVAKAHADYILISGHDGGTGASPLSSIKHTGIPWEVGLAEAQQVLRLNGLRGRVRLRVDGGLKTGRDVLVAALLGADEFAFGTAALVALGCDMARQCHLDTCPTGIATQREDLRGRFEGKPEHVAAFLLAVAGEVRELLAAMGARTLEEVIGRADLLAVRDDRACGGAPAGEATRFLAPLLAAAPEGASRRHHAPAPLPAGSAAEDEHERRLLDDALPLLERGGSVLLRQRIHNGERAVGARMAGAIAARFGDDGLPRGTLISHYTGSAGQSFGAFCVPGLRLLLVGDANDYVGKGMTGGEIVVMPSPAARFEAHEQILLGNTVLYGATGGLLLARGRAGERFAVRNSGAIAVVEGVGDHGCEYMTGGVVIVLGATGRNFAAGMTGGLAYVFDADGALPGRLNAEMVHSERLTDDDDESETVRALIEYHAEATGSTRAAELLAAWPATRGQMWRVVPRTLADERAPLGAVTAYLHAAAGAVTVTPPARITAGSRHVLAPARVAVGW
jgi:glutamate synthase domain-containing protein 2/glutamate synthase domain-containing protein 1/glutamate synthase domain-containing protein 3